MLLDLTEFLNSQNIEPRRALAAFKAIQSEVNTLALSEDVIELVNAPSTEMYTFLMTCMFLEHPHKVTFHGCIESVRGLINEMTAGSVLNSAGHVTTSSQLGYPKAEVYKLLQRIDVGETAIITHPRTTAHMTYKLKLLAKHIVPEQPFYSVPLHTAMGSSVQLNLAPVKVFSLTEFLKIQIDSQMTALDIYAEQIRDYFDLLNFASVESDHLYSLNDFIIFTDTNGDYHVGAVRSWNANYTFDYDFPRFDGELLTHPVDVSSHRFFGVHKPMITDGLFAHEFTRRQPMSSRNQLGACCYLNCASTNAGTALLYKYGMSKHAIILGGLLDYGGVTLPEFDSSNLSLLCNSERLYNHLVNNELTLVREIGGE